MCFLDVNRTESNESAAPISRTTASGDFSCRFEIITLVLFLFVVVHVALSLRARDSLLSAGGLYTRFRDNDRFTSAETSSFLWTCQLLSLVSRARPCDDMERENTDVNSSQTPIYRIIKVWNFCRRKKRWTHGHLTTSETTERKVHNNSDFVSFWRFHASKPSLSLWGDRTKLISAFFLSSSHCYVVPLYRIFSHSPQRQPFCPTLFGKILYFDWWRLSEFLSLLFRLPCMWSSRTFNLKLLCWEKKFLSLQYWSMIFHTQEHCFLFNMWKLTSRLITHESPHWHRESSELFVNKVQGCLPLVSLSSVFCFW